MASFDPYESNESPDIMGIIKYPMKRLELSVRNFIKVLDVALDRLHRHSENIKKVSILFLLSEFFNRALGNILDG